MGDLDAFRCAKLLLDRYGQNAGIHAALRADELESAGDRAGYRVWLRILSAIDELARSVPRVGERVH